MKSSRLLSVVMLAAPAVAWTQEETPKAPAIAQEQVVLTPREWQMVADSLETELRNLKASIQDATPRVGILVGEKNEVIGLFKDGPAARAGVRLGDTVAKIDGQDAPERNDETVALLRKSVGTVKLTLRRGGEEVEVAVEKRPIPVPGDFIARVQPRLDEAAEQVVEFRRKVSEPDVEKRQKDHLAEYAEFHEYLLAISGAVMQASGLELKEKPQ